MDLFTHYDAKSHSVVVTAKHSKQAKPRSANPSYQVRWVKPKHGETTWVYPAAVAPKISTVEISDGSKFRSGWWSRESFLQTAVSAKASDVVVVGSAVAVPATTSVTATRAQVAQAGPTVSDVTISDATVSTVTSAQVPTLRLQAEHGSPDRVYVVTTDVAKGSTSQGVTFSPSIAKPDSDAMASVRSVNSAHALTIVQTPVVVDSNGGQNFTAYVRSTATTPTTYYEIQGEKGHDPNIYGLHRAHSFVTTVPSNKPCQAHDRIH